MSVAELVLDYIRVLIWPALIAVGVFWLFRSQLGTLLAERRVKRVEAAGVKVELEPVAEVLKENLQETREELAKANDPQERERTAEKLEREAAALGRVQAVQDGGFSEDPVAEVGRYERSLAGEAWARGLSGDDVEYLRQAFYSSIDEGRRLGLSLSDAIQRVRDIHGSPQRVVDAWIEEKERRGMG
jgi:hypothetical protein